jgi:hypothetical protein
MRYRYCWVALSTLFLASVAGSAMQRKSERIPTVRHSIFTRDGQFQFSYPANPQVIEQGHVESWMTECDRDAIVCVVYPKKTSTGREYGSSTFQVREIQLKDGEMTEDICVTPYPSDPSGGSKEPEFLISAREPSKVIGGILFVHGTQEMVAGPQSSSADLYLAFHNRRCFELSVSDFGTDASRVVDDDDSKPTPTLLHKKESDPFPQILRSFRFLK